MRIRLLLFLLSVVLLSACGDQYKTADIEKEVKSGKKISDVMQLQNREQLVATIYTNHGKICFEMYPAETPKAVENFIGLTLQGYYNKLTFHRIVRNFMIQTGDSTATGTAGRSYFGKEFEDECPTSLKHNTAGTVSMANRGPHTNTSQFFITTVATPWLDGKHTLFGKVIEGMEVVHEIGTVETDNMEKPVKPVIIQKIIIEKRIR